VDKAAGGKGAVLRKLLDGLLVVMLTGSLALGSWGMQQVVTLNEQVAAMQAREFTVHDALEVWREIHALRADVAELDGRKLDRGENPAGCMGPELMRRVDRLQTEVDRAGRGHTTPEGE